MLPRSAGAAVLLLGLAAVALAACGGDSGPSTGPTLAPIQTTSSVPITVLTATTVPQYYEVQRGDTLTQIAVAFGLPVVAIMQMNGMTDPNDVQAGQILALPPRSIVATGLPPTVPGQTAPSMPTTTGVTTTTGV